MAGAVNAMSRMVSATLLVRVVALLAGVLGMIGERLDVPSFVAIVLLGGTSLLGLRIADSVRLASVLTRHPLLVVLDEVVVILVLAVVGVDSPLVLATCTTAFLVGLLLPLLVGVPGVVILAGGYLLVAALGDPSLDGGFLVVVLVPSLYLMLFILGIAVRGAFAARRESEEQVSLLRMAESARVERERLARELHDSLAKTVHGTGLLASGLSQWIDRDPAEAKRQAEIIAEASGRAAREARTLLQRLRVDQLDRPLSDVVRQTAEAWSQRYGIPARVRIGGVVDVMEQDRYELLAAFDEALENVAKHAHASAVEVTLSRADDVVSLVVQDDGVGIADRRLADAVQAGRYGIVGMRERLAHVGGQADVSMSPDGGTTVTLSYPVGGRRHV
jgi:signal transduction histidine kinase